MPPLGLAAAAMAGCATAVVARLRRGIRTSPFHSAGAVPRRAAAAAGSRAVLELVMQQSLD